MPAKVRSGPLADMRCRLQQVPVRLRLRRRTRPIGDAITRRTSAFRDRPRGLRSARVAQETENCCARRLIERSDGFRKDRRTWRSFFLCRHVRFCPIADMGLCTAGFRFREQSGLSTMSLKSLSMAVQRSPSNVAVSIAETPVKPAKLFDLIKKATRAPEISGSKLTNRRIGTSAPAAP